MKDPQEKTHKHTTIREISRISGVSIATVSRVINNPESTSPEIRERVMKVIEEYNYVPNQLARNLFSKTSDTIAIFVFDMSNPFFIELVKVTNRLAFDKKHTLIVCDTENDEQKEIDYLNYCQSTRTAGVIITEGTSIDVCTKAAYSMPLVLLDRVLKDSPYPVVTSDNADGIHKALGYLQNLNHRRIGFVSGPREAISARDRLNTYLTIMREQGREVQEGEVFPGDFSIKSGVHALDHFLSQKEKPSAVVCSNDQMAKGMIFRAHALGIRIPEDLSIIGFDGVDGEFFYPNLTTIVQDVNAIASYLIDTLIKGSKEGPNRHVVPVKLHVGETCRRV